MPLDITEATYLCPPMSVEVTMQELLVYHARQLQKWPADLDCIRGKVFKSCLDAARKLEEWFRHVIKDFQFQKGDLVLVRNNKINMELDCKTKP